ncbi:hypothetical protein EYC84_007533 [Monilinia fructicola]|uniref:C2H2-type domain-containing protein n=1 Tax=Monilinia fructicola TaxID=38448 RepID=A0A5M9JL88_MONFR|nr:hypothetical protein EYC84_007533 [Monilinia fructicola]
MTESADTYFDPDDVVPRDSPIFKPMHIIYEPEPSPEANLPPRISPEASPGERKGGKRSSNRAYQADVVLVSYMGGGKCPEIARNAGDRALPPCEDEDDEGPARGTAVEVPGYEFSPGKTDLDITRKMAADAVDLLRAHEDQAFKKLRETSQGSLGEAPAISKSLAITNTNLHAQNATDIPKFSPHSLEPYQKAAPEANIQVETQSSLPPGELPPMRHSPQSGLSNGSGNQPITLPSITPLLGDLNKHAEAAPTPNETCFSQSPGRPTSRFAPGPGATSPARSPNDFRREMISPGRPPFYFVSGNPRRPSQSDGPHYIAAGDYSSSSNTETPSTDQSGSTPATMGIDRMSIDGITNPQVGGFQCTNPGCTAPPFQTQYLLNSHANVHSSNRPHYCTVKGCPRAEGGKGFKRKNEMIRHGLVHDSPGYVCPFCPEREHRYPRPDNLQRHVRVHHTDRDKDDPQLREVLAQRPEGPSRGRRRRGGLDISLPRQLAIRFHWGWCFDDYRGLNHDFTGGVRSVLIPEKGQTCVSR